jgi:hypothetical protein
MLELNPLSQIHNFLRCTSPQISKSQFTAKNRAEIKERPKKGQKNYFKVEKRLFVFTCSQSAVSLFPLV